MAAVSARPPRLTTSIGRRGHDQPVGPFINTYAAFFLIGEALVSAWRFRNTKNADHRAAGNALIAFGALLPAIGGTFAKAGLVEALYVAEFVGLVFIWAGERTCALRPAARGAMSIQPDGIGTG